MRISHLQSIDPRDNHGVLPTEKFLHRQPIAHAGFIHGDQAALNRQHHLRLATTHPTPQVRRRKIGTRKLLAVRANDKGVLISSVTSHCYISLAPSANKSLMRVMTSQWAKIVRSNVRRRTNCMRTIDGNCPRLQDAYFASQRHNFRTLRTYATGRHRGILPKFAHLLLHASARTREVIRIDTDPPSGAGKVVTT